MATVINIKPELEQLLLESITDSEISMNDYVNTLLEDFLKEKKQNEKDLLRKINLGVESKDWKRYYTLVEKKDDTMLTEKEHVELVKMSEEIEIANDKKLKYLLELSQSKGIDLEVLMNELGLNIPKYE